MNDPLSNFVDKSSGSNLYIKFKSNEPVKLRVLTNDPIVTIDKFGNTRFNFVVWNWTDNQAMILSKGASILNQLKTIHTDPDYGDIRKIDVKITATGEGMETRYNVMPLPTSQELSGAAIEEASKIDLEKICGDGGVRLSKYNDGAQPVASEEQLDEEPQSGYAKAKAVAESLKSSTPIDTVSDVDMDEPINLDDIPF